VTDQPSTLKEGRIVYMQLDLWEELDKIAERTAQSLAKQEATK